MPTTALNERLKAASERYPTSKATADTLAASSRSIRPIDRPFIHIDPEMNF
jgi:hypothetical protein